ncbi:ESCO1/2 acetyl-transferase-domain-containing protein [Powellomyces hirtus]|nr:ESCO1/2 acetyl-transferase-domain-containing protein [Powellomyces hirtus]
MLKDVQLTPGKKHEADSAEQLGPKKPRVEACLPITNFFQPANSKSSPSSRNPAKPKSRTSNSSQFSSKRSSSSTSNDSNVSSTSTSTSISAKRKQTQTYEQLYLDLGQRDSGVRTCPECRMEYSKAKPEDDVLHSRYHRAVVYGVEWQGYKGELTACEYPDGARTVVVTDTCNAFLRKKAGEVVALVNAELGSAPMDLSPGTKIFLYIASNKRITGCVVAEPRATAYRVVPSPPTQPETTTTATPTPPPTQSNGSVTYNPVDHVPALCGISRIWVLKSERRKGVGGLLLHAVCAKFIFGCPLTSSQLAFTEPTMAGKRLAERVCGRRDFLVY